MNALKRLPGEPSGDDNAHQMDGRLTQLGRMLQCASITNATDHAYQPLGINVRMLTKKLLG
jgi:hypothetical protein